MRNAKPWTWVEIKRVSDGKYATFHAGRLVWLSLPKRIYAPYDEPAMDLLGIENDYEIRSGIMTSKYGDSL